MKKLGLILALFASSAFAQVGTPFDQFLQGLGPLYHRLDGSEVLPCLQNAATRGCTAADFAALYSITLTSPDGSLGITGSPSATLTAIVNASNITTGILALTHGGTGTATAAIVPGTNVTVSGSWPNQTINSATNVTLTSPDSSIALTGSPGSSLTAAVNASGITVGTVPVTALPALTSNGVQMVQAIATVANMCGLPFIDGVNGTDGNDVLLAHQTTPSQNGPWRMHSGACPGAGNWTRPPWFQDGSTTQAVNNMSVLVAPAGVAYGSSTWTLQFAPTPVVIGTTTQQWFVSQPKSVSTLAGVVGRNGGTRAADEANVAEYGAWGGTIRHNYGNSNAVSGVSCTQGSTTIGLANVTIPANYNGGDAEIPGCGNPGAINSANPGARAQSFTFAAGGTGYVPKQIITCSGGTSTVPCQTIIYSTIVNALPVVAAGGSGCTPGAQTFTGTTGIAGSSGTNYFTVTGTVSGGGVLQSPLTAYAANGPYTEKPINWSAEPVTGGNCAVPPTIDLSNAMGANTGSVYVAGNYTSNPTGAVSFTPAPLPISTMVWQAGGGGTVTVTIATFSQGSASTLPGWMYPGWVTGTSSFPVTISGATPSSYNGTYTATVVGPNGFQFALASNPGSDATVPGLYTISPASTGATANLFWYGNPLIGTISNIVNSGGNATFTISNAANFTLTQGGGKAFLWLTTDDVAFGKAIATGAQTIKIPNPPVVPGFESGYSLSAGLSLSGMHRWDFDCEGGFITGAPNDNSPTAGAVLTVNAASSFRAQAMSTVSRCDLDPEGGFERAFTAQDWDWDIGGGNLFENATLIDVAWEYSSKRESRLRDSAIINDGYNPLTFPYVGLDSEAPDTRITGINIMQGFQQTAIFSNAATGDVHYTDIHAEGVVGGPIFAEKGAGNHWDGGDLADNPPPGFAGYIAYNGFDTVLGMDVEFSGTWAGQLGILNDVSAQHGIYIGNTPNRGGIPAAYACIDQSPGGLSTNGNRNTWQGNQGCSPIPIGLPFYTVATLPSCTAVINLYSLATVTDAASPTYNGALTGSGTNKIPVFCNGTSWVAH